MSTDPLDATALTPRLVRSAVLAAFSHRPSPGLSLWTSSTDRYAAECGLLHTTLDLERALVHFTRVGGPDECFHLKCKAATLCIRDNRQVDLCRRSPF